jgi:glycosyltransferase involved in cell wall biosynthesis
MVQAIKRADRGAGSSVVHTIGSPLALGPFVRTRSRHLVAHIPLSQQAYLPFSERIRAELGWRLFDRWIDAYACTSQRIVEALLKKGYPAAKLHVVEPPLDVQFFQPADRAASRQRLGIDPDAFVVGYVGTVSPLRFPAEEVMQALRSAASTIPNLVLEVFAPHATHAYNEQWSQDNVGRAAQESDVPVHMHLQDLTEHEKTIVYSAADVVILPFKAPVAVEPPLTALEAMACETITAVSPAANRSNIVQDGVNGHTWDSPEALAACLMRVYALSPEQRTALEQAGRASVVQRFSYETTVGAIENVWRAIGAHPHEAA